jgi:rhodanese-related sulfurtransferase
MRDDHRSMRNRIAARRIESVESSTRGGSMPLSIDRDEVRRLLDEGAQLVEVLPAEEYEDEHLPGARNIPLKALDGRAASSLERERPVIVYCYDYQ